MIVGDIDQLTSSYGISETKNALVAATNNLARSKRTATVKLERVERGVVASIAEQYL